MSENGIFQIIVPSATVLGIAVYIFHDWYTGYKAFRTDMYDKLKEKQPIEQCNEYRRLEERHEDQDRRKEVRP